MKARKGLVSASSSMGQPEPEGHDKLNTSTTLGQLVAGRYSIIGLLGRGGMAKVFEAYDTVLNRTVAVKIMDASDMTEHRVVRFHRGAKAASSINHPNVVKTLDFGLTGDGRPFMVMELVRGITLRAILKSTGAILPELALQLIEQICQGIAVAHKQGIVHRDLTPANIIVEGLGTNEVRAKILDFGIATSKSQDGEPVTNPGEVVGSPVYMSPEQVQGKQVDTRSDIYSVGCILFELLAGKPAFLGKSSLETMSLHVLEAPPSLAERSAQAIEGVEEIDTILQKAMAKKPESRYRNVDELRNDILACIPGFEYRAEENSQENYYPSNSETMRITQKKWWIVGLFSMASGLLILGLAVLVYGICQQPSKAESFFGAEKAYDRAINRALSTETERFGLFAIVHTFAEHKNKFLSSGEKLHSDLAKLKKDKQAAERTDTFIIRGGKLDSRDLKTILSMKPIGLCLADCSVTDQQVDMLSKCSSLMKLSLSGNKNITKAGLSKLRELKRLTQLAIANCDIDNTDLAQLKDIQGLTYIDLENNRAVSKEGLELFVREGRIEPLTLCIHGCQSQNMSPKEIKHLSMELVCVVTQEKTKKLGES